MTYIFLCPLCKKLFKTDQPGEPLCTGPSEMSDDHEPVVMRISRAAKEDIDPILAEHRARGTLLVGNGGVH